MEQLNQQDHHHLIKQQIQTPTSFNIKEPSIIRTQFATKPDPSFDSHLQTNHSNDRTKTQLKTHQENTNNTHNATEETDQISIFDAAKYFNDINNDTNATNLIQNGSSKVVDLTSIGRLSSVSSSIDTINNYGRRSFLATPSASSEASWNSRTGLLTNTHGYEGINKTIFSPKNDDKVSNVCKRSTKWYKIINPKWLIPPRKCPCSGKKSVQVDERIVQVKPTRVVDLQRSSSSNDGSKLNTSSFYSMRQNSPCNNSLSSDISTNGCSSSRNSNHNHKMIDSLKLVGDHGNDISVTSGVTSHGFTFPILEDHTIAVNKMFNVISCDQQQLDLSRDSLEVFQLKSHTSPRSRRMSYEDENVSDCSSDLFEIESFSTTYQRRNSIDGNENVITTNNKKKFGLNEEPMLDFVASNECYAPSEVSVDWSVATAKGLSISEPEIGIAATRKAAEKNGGGGGGGGGGGVRKDEGKNGGGLLMNCKCEKAVSVGPGPIKCSADGPPVMVARHVGGRAEVKQERKLGTLAQVGNNGNGKVGLVVGRQMSNLVPIPIGT